MRFVADAEAVVAAARTGVRSPPTGPPTPSCGCVASSGCTPPSSSTVADGAADHRRGGCHSGSCWPAPSTTSRSRSSRYYAELLKTCPVTDDLGNIEPAACRTTAGWRRKPPASSPRSSPTTIRNQLALAKLAPALAAGCTVVPSAAPDTPLITLALGELIANHADIPAGVVNVLSGADPEVGAVLTTSPDVDMVTFTGSIPTGRAIVAAASNTLKRVFRSSAAGRRAIVLDDADFNMAALFAAFSMVPTPARADSAHVATSGAAQAQRRDRRGSSDQSRPCPLRRSDEPVPTTATNDSTYVARWISAKQRDLRSTAWSSDAAVTAGASPGHRRREEGSSGFYTPTLRWPTSTRTARDRPGRGVRPGARGDRSRGDDDAVRIANNSILRGLSGAIFGERGNAARRWRAWKIRAGTFSINGGSRFSPDRAVWRRASSRASAAEMVEGRPSASSWSAETLTRRCSDPAIESAESGKPSSRPLAGSGVLEVAMYGSRSVRPERVLAGNGAPT